MNKPSTYVWFAGALCAASVAGYLVAQPGTSVYTNNFVYELQPATLVRPVLDIVGTESQSEWSNTLRKGIERMVSLRAARGEVSRVSVFYQDLGTLDWVGVADDDLYDPASLLKVSLLVAYLKLAEADPALLATDITYNQEFVADENTVPLPSGVYGLQFLLERMIIHSDNVAYRALSTYLQQYATDEQLQQVLENGDMLVGAVLSDGQSVTTVSDYAGVLRVLYSAMYLTNDASEYALELLSQSAFDVGLRAGVPDTITTANKFGFGGDPADPNDFQLHDCGVVYDLLQPYILCIFTQSIGERESARIIRDISAYVYEQHQERYTTR